MSIAARRAAGGSDKDPASPRLRVTDNGTELGGGEPGEVSSILDAPVLKLQRVLQAKPFQLHQIQKVPLMGAKNRPVDGVV